MKKRDVSAIAAIVSVIVLLCIGCFEGPAGPQGETGMSKPSIRGVVGMLDEYDTEISAIVCVENTKDIPSVSINGTALSRGSSEYSEYSLSGNYFNGALESPTENAQLSAQFTMLDGKKGNATATMAIPGNFMAGVLGLDLDEGYSYYVTNYYEDQTFYFAWSASPRVSKYIVELWGWIEIEDEDWNELIDTEMNIVFSTTNTSFTLPVSDLFSESVLSFMADPDNDVYCDLYFDFYAINGPYSSGEMGNVSGDAYGFFNGMTSGGTINIEIHEPSVSKVEKNSSYEHQKKQPPSRDGSLLKYLLSE